MIKVRCPICDKRMSGQASDWPDYPFCSPRCRQIDLGRWLGEAYRIPSVEQAVDDEDESKSSSSSEPDE